MPIDEDRRWLALASELLDFRDELAAIVENEAMPERARDFSRRQLETIRAVPVRERSYAEIEALLNSHAFSPADPADPAMTSKAAAERWKREHRQRVVVAVNAIARLLNRLRGELRDGLPLDLDRVTGATVAIGEAERYDGRGPMSERPGPRVSARLCAALEAREEQIKRSRASGPPVDLAMEIAVAMELAPSKRTLIRWMKGED